jgi:hypothetical protein
MCAINPKRQRHFKLSVYTSADMTEEEFEDLVRTRALATEILLNGDGRLRWHLSEMEGVEGTDHLPQAPDLVWEPW